MAKKRMFNVDIVENDVFLDMPSSSQNLYFHLCMNADDDGFVGPKKVMRMCAASQDDLQVLIAKRYILVFESGVAVIKHWTVNNTIKKDRHVKTTYQVEFNSLTFNEWGVYTEKRSTKLPEVLRTSSGKSPENDDDSITTSNSGQSDALEQNVSGMSPQYRLDKVRLDQNSINNINVINKRPDKKSSKKLEKIPTTEITEMMEKWNEIVGMDIDNIANRKACASLIREVGKEKLIRLIKGTALALDDKYAPRVSDFVSLKYKKNDLIIWGRKNNTNSNVEIIS